MEFPRGGFDFADDVSQGVGSRLSEACNVSVAAAGVFVVTLAFQFVGSEAIRR